MDGEIVVERRRQCTPEEKAALMAEVEAEGGHASVVAQRDLEEPVVQLAIGPEGRRSASASRAVPSAEIRSAWCRCRRRPGPDDTNDNWRGMPAGTGLALAERGWGSSARR